MIWNQFKEVKVTDGMITKGHELQVPLLNIMIIIPYIYKSLKLSYIILSNSFIPYRQSITLSNFQLFILTHQVI